MSHLLKRVVFKSYLFINGVKHFAALPFRKKLFSSESYYPEYSNKKNKICIYFEQCLNILKYGAPNDFYFLYGFDIKGFKNRKGYVDNLEFRNRRESLNRKDDGTIIVLRDKFLFGLVAEGLGVNTPHNIALVDGSKLFLHVKDSGEDSVNIKDLALVFPTLDGFAKLIDGECANGVFHMEIKDSSILVDGEPMTMEQLSRRFNDHRHIIQQRITQHDAINAIYPNAINTIRLVTVYDERTNQIEVLSCVLRVGCGKNHVDNWAVGGLSIGIDTETCTLRKYGFYKPGFGTKTAVHPNSNVVFEGYPIPFLKEAIEDAKRFHFFIKNVHSIGWDIAVTPSGPCFIEGNDNWEISLMQVCNHGYQKEFNNLFLQK